MSDNDPNKKLNAKRLEIEAFGLQLNLKRLELRIMEIDEEKVKIGQNGVLAQGAVTSAAPTYTTGQTDPLSLTTAGALRTDSSATTQPVSGTVTANAGSGTFAVNQT